MTPDDFIHADSVHIIPEDWDDIADGEIDLAGVSLLDLTESARHLSESAERV